MAIDPSASYTGQVDLSDLTGYPHGKARNSASLGDGIGWPLEKDWINDVLGFQQALLAAASLTPSGTPDKVGASQYLSALNALILAAQPGAAFTHAALRRWQRTIPDRTASETWSQVVGIQPVRSFDTNGERQRLPLLLGANSGTRLIVALSNDGTAPEVPRSLNTTTPFAPPSYAAPGKPGEAMTVDGSNIYYQYTTDHGNSFTVVVNAFPGAAVHYVPASGVYLYLDSHGGFFRGTSISTFPTGISLGITAADPAVSEFADNGASQVVLVSRVSGHSFASIFLSGDGGITWALVRNLSGFFANVTWSKALGLFFAWDDSGAMLSSPNGAIWTTLASGLFTSHGFLAGSKTLACVGPAVVKAWSYQPSANFTQQGIRLASRSSSGVLMPFDLDIRDSDYRRDPERPRLNHGAGRRSCNHEGCNCPVRAVRLVGAERSEALDAINPNNQDRSPSQ